MTIPVTDPSVYADFAGLDRLKRAARAHDPQALRAVARQFESLFARMMIKSMRDAVGTDPIFGSDQEKMYQGMFDDQLSVDLTRGRGLGLADMLIRQLQRTDIPAAGAAAGPSPASAAPSATPAAAKDAVSAQGTASGSASTSSGAPARSLSYDRLPAVRHDGHAFSLRQRALSLHSPAPAQHRPVSSAARTRFIRSIWPHAAQAARALGVSPASVIAQAALETNWGQDVPRDPGGRSSHNLFGIKAGDGWSGASVSASTQEFSGPSHSAHATTAAFRVYGSAAQSFDDYVALLRGNPRFAAALGTGNDVQAFAAALQRGGYATDPDYAHKLSAVAASLGGLEPPAAGALKLADAQPINVSTRTL